MNSPTSKLVGTLTAKPKIREGLNSVSCIWKFKSIDLFGNFKTGDFLKSPVFTCLDDNNETTSWQLEYFPKGYNSQCSNYVSIFLRSLNNKECKVSCTLMACPQVEVFSELFPKQSTFGVQKFCKRGTVTLFNLFQSKIEIEAYVYFIRSVHQAKVEDIIDSFDRNFQIFENLVQLVQGISNMMINGDLTDCKILCQGQEIKCHAVILAARSPVFASMMSQPLKEKETRNICIEDFTIDIVREFVNFIYMGKVTIVKENAADLLKIAGKYKIKQLKDTCMKNLIAKTTVENCLYYAELGILYRVDELKSTAVKNITELMKTQEWKQNSAKNPELLSHILEAIALGNKPK